MLTPGLHKGTVKRGNTVWQSGNYTAATANTVRKVTITNSPAVKFTWIIQEENCLPEHTLRVFARQSQGVFCQTETRAIFSIWTKCLSFVWWGQCLLIFCRCIAPFKIHLPILLFPPPSPLFTPFIIGFIDPDTCPIQFRQWGTLNTHQEEIRTLRQIGLSDSLSACVCVCASVKSFSLSHTYTRPQYPMISSRVTAQYDKCEETSYNEKHCWKRGEDGRLNVCFCVCERERNKKRKKRN